MFSDIQHLQSLWETHPTLRRPDNTESFASGGAHSMYNTTEACTVPGCTDLMNNTYDQTSMPPHDRLKAGVSGWKDLDQNWDDNYGGHGGAYYSGA
eukprot:CAMPEP_0179405128 /NCGR_PEP_ID=MMETSP0799-20121207/98_1 /TAXON_ID=46947 /ORGANISM="Geminigera cryophila, Strain CCMP2564" /LENGTH=95 /DNA_ID=CAMNT_0021175909 /DNA_START=41 /DNA_END=328 /DNA_ORIENTATION=+